jgi:hypothetical protein
LFIFAFIQFIVISAILSSKILHSISIVGVSENASSQVGLSITINSSLELFILLFSSQLQLNSHVEVAPSKVLPLSLEFK